MQISRRRFLRSSAAAVVAVPVLSPAVLAQDTPIRIGVLYDCSGPLAAAGSVASAIGVQIAIDLVNERAGP
jgi:branched-chain amino acid transport system substrate-binding protein